ncbi:zinc-ribbon domain-containing protein [Nocardioides pakistanensis]
MRHLPSRHPKGTPFGGRFAPSSTGEADLALHPTLDIDISPHRDAMTAPDAPVLWHPGNDTGLATATDDTPFRWIYRGCGHIVTGTARAVAAQSGCPECNPPGYHHPMREIPTNPATCLAVLRPDLAACIDPALNGGWEPDRIPVDYRGTVVWSMPCGHTWRGKVRGRTDDACWVCDSRTLVPGVNDLHTLHPQIAATAPARLNGGLHPVEVRPTERLRRLTWHDPSCGHTWRDTPYNRVVLGRGCAECAPRSRAAA